MILGTLVTNIVRLIARSQRRRYSLAAAAMLPRPLYTLLPVKDGSVRGPFRSFPPWLVPVADQAREYGILQHA